MTQPPINLAAMRRAKELSRLRKRLCVGLNFLSAHIGLTSSELAAVERGEVISDEIIEKAMAILTDKNHFVTSHKNVVQMRAQRLSNQRRWYKKARDTNPEFRCRMAMAGRIREALISKKAVKTATTMRLVGCSRAHLKWHIKKQFKPGMTWENHGKWHIDHIRPCSSFNLLLESEQRACFHFTNLQPLWAHENLSKSDKLIYATISTAN